MIVPSALVLTAVFRWVVMPRFGLVPTDESGFLFQAAMLVLIILVFVGSIHFSQFLFSWFL